MQSFGFNSTKRLLVVYIIYIRIKASSLPTHMVLLSTLFLRARNTTLNKDN